MEKGAQGRYSPPSVHGSEDQDPTEASRSRVDLNSALTGSRCQALLSLPAGLQGSKLTQGTAQASILQRGHEHGAGA